MTILAAGRDTESMQGFSALHSVLPALTLLAINTQGGPQEERIDRYRLDANARSLDSFFGRADMRPLKERLNARMRLDGAYRADAPAGGIQGGLFLARQLEQVATRVLRQPAQTFERPLHWRMNHRGQRAMRLGDYKYLRVDGNDYLFNIPADERERANLGKHQPERLQAMRSAWEAWNASMPPIPQDATISLGYSYKDMPQR